MVQRRTVKSQKVQNLKVLIDFQTFRLDDFQTVQTKLADFFNILLKCAR